jgi:AbrB family looped-hinge helix DNA binding protein
MAKLPKNNVRVSPEGRVVIPAELRQQMEIKPGDVLVFMVEDGHLVLMTRQQVEESLWALFKDIPPDVSLTDRVIERRKREFQLEEEEREARKHARG